MATGTAQWRDIINQASRQTGVPASGIEAVMRLESNGKADALSPAGAVGLMQIMPQFWSHLGNIFSPAGNILVGAKILAQLQSEHGPKGPHGWDRAICAYFTGHPDPDGSSDGFSTDFQYVERVNQNWSDIDRETAGQHVILGPPASAGVVSDTAALLRQPASDAEVIATLRQGSVVELTHESTNGYLKVTSDGQEGWMHSGFLTARVAEELKLRSTPQLLDNDANVVAGLAPGTMVRFKGSARPGFVEIEHDGGPAWVFGEFLAPAGGGSFPAAGSTAKTTMAINVRRTPSLRTNENVIGALAAGDTVTLTGKASVGYVSLAGPAGAVVWGYAEYLGAGTDAPKPDAATQVAGTKVTVSEAGVRLRSAPVIDPGNILVDGLPARATVTLTGQARDGFMSVRHDDIEGWVAAQFLRARVTDTGVRLRSAPDTSDPMNIIVDGMDFGAEVGLNGQAENGFLSVDYRGTAGWTAAAYLGPLPGTIEIAGNLLGHITQDYLNPTGPDLYSYGTFYGLDGRAHPGIDYGLPYGTTLRAPMGGTITCAGTGKGRGADGAGCGAFNDTGDCCPVNGVSCGSVGAGRIEMLLDNGAMLIFGHCRECFHAPGARIEAGQEICSVGGMCGSHFHLEARVRDAGTLSGWRIVDPHSVISG
jgi:SH3-like domain-containing protein